MKRGFLFTMECGRVFISIVTGEDEKHCEGLAASAVQEVHDSQIYDVANYPVESCHKDGATELDTTEFDA